MKILGLVLCCLSINLVECARDAGIKIGKNGEILECTRGADGKEVCLDRLGPSVGGDPKLLKMIQDNEKHQQKLEEEAAMRKAEKAEREAQNKDKPKKKKKPADNKKDKKDNTNVDLDKLLKSPIAAKEIKRVIREGEELDLGKIITMTLQQSFANWGKPEAEIQPEPEDDDDTEVTMELFMQAMLRTMAKQSGEGDPFKDLAERPDKQEYLERLSKLMTSFNDKERDMDLLVQDLLTFVSPEQNAQDMQHIETMMNATARLKTTLQEVLGDMGLDVFHPLQLYYYMQEEEKVKNPVWKRQKHRFQTSTTKDEVLSMVDGLYLSQLSYVKECSDMEELLNKFQVKKKTGQGMWAMRNCTTTSKPFQPAHFLATMANPSKKKKTPLEAVLVIRGSQEASDMLSVTAFKPVPYKDGYAHEGIKKSGEWIRQQYGDELKALLKQHRASQGGHKLPLKLYVLGHSLGAGAATIATMEFNDMPGVEAFAVGFGTPAVLSPELSLSVKDRVTTVVTDSDCVPRLTKSSIRAAWREVIQYNFTDSCLHDIYLLAPLAQEKALILGKWTGKIIDGMREKMEEKMVDDAISQLEQADEALAKMDDIVDDDEILIPPGDCVHFYRDGTSWQSVHSPCDDFQEIEVVQRMVDDHFVNGGYYPAMVEYLRKVTGDMNFRPKHEVSSIPV